MLRFIVISHFCCIEVKFSYKICHSNFFSWSTLMNVAYHRRVCKLQLWNHISQCVDHTCIFRLINYLCTLCRMCIWVGQWDPVPAAIASVGKGLHSDARQTAACLVCQAHHLHVFVHCDIHSTVCVWETGTYHKLGWGPLVIPGQAVHS